MPVGTVRYYTVEEARATLAVVRPVLAALRAAWHDHAFARGQVEDLASMYGEALDEPAHPEAAEYAKWRAEADTLRERVEGLLQEVTALGVEVKDPTLGLIDFYAKRGDDTVFLCFRDDEDDITHWHTLTGGFQARRPLDEF